MYVTLYLADHPQTLFQGLVQFAHQRRDAALRREAEADKANEMDKAARRSEEAAREAERAIRRAHRRVLTAAVTTMRPVAVVPRSGSTSTPPKASVPPSSKRSNTERYPCGTCHSIDHWTRLCPSLPESVRTQMARVRAQPHFEAPRSPHGCGCGGGDGPGGH